MKRAVIVVAGNRYHGKDTLSDLLQRHLREASVRESYILPLREAVHAKTGIPWEVLAGPNTVKDDPRFGRYGKSARQFLIEEGDHARAIDPAILVHRLAERVATSPVRVTVVSDGRMPDTEIVGLRQCLDEQGATDVLVIAIRVTRADYPVKLDHPTESAIYNAPASLFDFVVCNDGSLDDLDEIAGGIVDEIVARLT